MYFAYECLRKSVIFGFVYYCAILFDSVVAIAFQNVFYVEMHQNNIFLFFKNYFLNQHIKTIQNIQKNINF